MSLRIKVALFLLLFVVAFMGVADFLVCSILYQANRYGKSQEKLRFKSGVLERFRFASLELGNRAYCMASSKGVSSLEAVFRSAHKKPEPEIDMMAVVDGRGAILYRSGATKGDPMILPSPEVLISPPLSGDAFLFASFSDTLFLLGAAPSPFSEEILVLGSSLASLADIYNVKVSLGKPNPSRKILSRRTKDFSSSVIESTHSFLEDLPFPRDLSGKEGLPLSPEDELVLYNEAGVPRATVLLSYPPDLGIFSSGIVFRIHVLFFIAGLFLFLSMYYFFGARFLESLEALSTFLQRAVEKKKTSESQEYLSFRQGNPFARMYWSVNALVEILEKARRKEIQNTTRWESLSHALPGVLFRARTDQRLTKIFVSPQFADLTGYLPEDIVNNRRISTGGMVFSEDRTRFFGLIRQNIDEGKSYVMRYRMVRRDKTLLWVEEHGHVVYDHLEGESFIDGVIMDMGELKRLEDHVEGEKDRYGHIARELPQTAFLMDTKGHLLFLNSSGASTMGYSCHEIEERGFSWLTFFQKSCHSRLQQYLAQLLKGSQEASGEVTAQTKEGISFSAALCLFPVGTVESDKGEILVIVTSLMGQQRKTEAELYFLSMHDALTGLYNRTFVTEEVLRLESGRFDPLGVIMCDLDGLKLVNDTMGHAMGDRLLISTASLLRKTFRVSDIISRIGGDEFLVILPQCPEEMLQKIFRRLREKLETYNDNEAQIPLGLSMGCAFRDHSEKTSCRVSLEKLIDEADSAMYRDKLQKSARMRENFVRQLYHKSLYDVRGHQIHARRIMLAFWDYIQKPHRQRHLAGLFALFHDIGCVGIPTEIMGKPGPLDEGEWNIVQRHPDLGHRIALSTPNLAAVAEWILRHHERPDGKGYPLGLAKEDIPEACLIFALVDAYTCMVTSRPFQEAISPWEAFDEIRRHRGTQFDEAYTDLFLKFMAENPEFQTRMDSEISRDDDDYNFEE